LDEETRKNLNAEERLDLDDELDGSIKERDALHKALKESMTEVRQYEADAETLRVLSESTAGELRAWASDYSPDTPDGETLRKLLAAHASWEARFGRNHEFRAALIASSQVVAGTCLGVMAIPGRKEITYDLCIVDEASIATPTEVLVPMSRARRTILVGDHKQLSPFQDPELKASGLLQKFDLTPADQKSTLFNHLIDALPAALKLKLKTQHRMLPPIGKLVSECFYDGDLLSVDRAPAAHLAGISPKPVVWQSTSRKAGKSSKALGTTHYNNLEIRLIGQILSRIDFTMRHGKGKGKKASVAVLTGYGEQKLRLKSAIDLQMHAWVSFSRDLRERDRRISGTRSRHRHFLDHAF
jgi:hypothetical protein